MFDTSHLEGILRRHAAEQTYMYMCVERERVGVKNKRGERVREVERLLHVHAKHKTCKEAEELTCCRRSRGTACVG